MKPVILMLGVALALAGCAAQPVQAIEDPYYPGDLPRDLPTGVDLAPWMTIQENLAAGQWDFTLTNHSTGRLCIDGENWPLPGGGMHYAMDSVFVEQDGKRYPIRPGNTGYCPGGCRIVVPAGTTLKAFIGFKEFVGVDLSQPNPTRKLIFPLRTSRTCRAGYGRWRE